MPRLLAKYYDLDENGYEPIKSTCVLSVSEIISFVKEFGQKGRTWMMLKEALIEESLARLGTNDWLKVAIQFDPVRSHLKDAGKRFIIITQRADEPCAPPLDEYNVVTVSGTHFSHKYLWNLWGCFVIVPWIIVRFVAYSCCCCSEDLNPIRAFTKQYTEKYSSISSV
jgi:hypothetical protein